MATSHARPDWPAHRARASLTIPRSVTRRDEARSHPARRPYFAVPWMRDWMNSNAVSPIGRHSAYPSLEAEVRCTPPHARLRLHSFSNSVNVFHGPRVMSVAEVTPGSITDDPAGAGQENPNESVP